MSSPLDPVIKHLPGLWCPWAEILCYPCHGSESNRGEPMRDYDLNCQPREASDGEAKATCDRCERAVWLHQDIAAEQQVVFALRAAGIKSAGMQQTGGMCSAAGCHSADHNVLVTASEEEAGGYIAGLYKADQDECTDDAICATVDEVVKHVRRWFGIPDDLMIGVYNATKAAHNLIQEAWENAGRPDSRDPVYLEKVEFHICALLCIAEDSARGEHSRGEPLAFVEYEALKAEVLRIEDEEVQS